MTLAGGRLHLVEGLKGLDKSPRPEVADSQSVVGNAELGVDLQGPQICCDSSVKLPEAVIDLREIEHYEGVVGKGLVKCQKRFLSLVPFARHVLCHSLDVFRACSVQLAHCGSTPVFAFL